jgi:hypothetical protein
MKSQLILLLPQQKQEDYVNPVSSWYAGQTKAAEEHIDKSIVVTPQLVSEDVQKFVDSGAMTSILQADVLTFQGMRFICDTLHKYNMVMDGHTLEPVTSGTNQENYLKFYEQVRRGIKILITIIAGNHRVNAGDKSMQNRVAKPNNGLGLCSPTNESYLKNSDLNNWEHVSEEKDSEGAMVGTIEKLNRNEPNVFSTPLTVTVIVTRQNCSHRDLMKHLLARSEAIGTSNSGNSTKSFGRRVNTAALSTLGVGKETRTLPHTVGTSDYLIKGSGKRSAKFNVRVSDLSKDFSKDTESCDLISDEAGMKIMNGIVGKPSGGKDAVATVVVKEVASRKKKGKDIIVTESSKTSTLPVGASGATFNKSLHNGSNNNDVEFSHFTSSPAIVEAVFKFFGLEYDPEFALEFGKIMMGKKLTLESLDDNNKARLMIAQQVDTALNLTQPDDNSKNLIAVNIVNIMLVADEVSNDGKHFTQAIEQISQLITVHQKNNAYIANFLCEYIISYGFNFNYHGIEI